jgi:glycosyltransferase involved in cell wall biosynthesis
MKDQMRKVKTCVYAIALNEIKHVDKFMDANEGADLVLVCDTGSTDGTVERLRERGAVVYEITQRPWRFDVPRNTALSLIPADIDICLSIDLDEYLQPGWVEAIDKAWQETNGNIDRIAYDYIWNWKEDGVTPGIQFYADKIHARFGYRWRQPCHETLYWEMDRVENRVVIPEVVLHHRADPTKSRGQYLPLLKLAVKESPNDDRSAFYYARELFFYGHHEEAAEEFKRHLSIPSATWRPERAASMRYLAKCEPENKEAWLCEAIAEAPGRREALVEYAQYLYENQTWDKCYKIALEALDIKEKPLDYLCEDFAWGALPSDLAAIAAYNLGMYKEALIYGKVAASYEPDNERLTNNLNYYKEAAKVSSYSL